MLHAYSRLVRCDILDEKNEILFTSYHFDKIFSYIPNVFLRIP